MTPGWKLALSALGAAAASLAWGGPVPVRPPKTYDLKNVEWHVTLHPDDASIEGDVINSIHLLKPQDSVTFDCGPLTIASVTVNGVTTTSELKGETLTVALPDKGANKDLKIEIRYSGKPSAGVYFIDGKTAYPAHTPVVYSQGAAEDNRYWLPTYDFPDNKSTSEGFITVPKGWHVLSNGRMVDENIQADMTTAHWKMEQAHSTYLISFVAGPYEVGRESWGKMPVEYWVPEGLLDWGKVTFGGTNKIIDFYSKQLGVKYPYAKFAQSAVPEFMFGGMENITCVTQTISALFPPNEANTRDSTGLIAHELAHQWFGDLVTCASWKHTWINESFATFMPPFYTRATKGEDAFQEERAGVFRGARSMANAGAVATEDFNYPSGIYRGQVYSGGAARIFMLMDRLGEKKFWAGVHNFLETYKYQPVTTEQFFASVSKTVGEDLTPFMNQWLLTAGVPRISFVPDGSALVFKNEGPFFDLDPEAWIWSGKDWVKKPLHFTADQHEVRVEVGGDLVKAPVFIDPEGHFLLEQATPAEVPLGQGAPIFDNLPAFSKTEYLDKLASDPFGVVKLLDEPQNKRYRPRLVGLLDKGNKSLLRQLLWDDVPAVRLAAIARFRSLYTEEPHDDVEAALRADATTDAEPAVREAAFAALLQFSEFTGMALKAWHTDDPFEGYRLEALRWWEYHDKVAARQHALEALDTPLSEPVQLASIRLLGSLGDATGERKVYEHLVKILGGNAYLQKNAALRALVAYGDKSALPAIEAVTHEKMVFTREAAERAYKALQDKPASGGPPSGADE